MAKDNKFFEDFIKMAGSAMDTAFHSVNDMKTQFESMVQQRIESYLKKMHMVSREEFEVVKAMAAKAREEQEALQKRLEVLEKKKHD